MRPESRGIDTRRRPYYVPAPFVGGGTAARPTAQTLRRALARILLATHQSALKRIRQSQKRQARNPNARSRMRTIVKSFKAALANGDSDSAEKLRAAEREIRKAATKGLIPARRASRTISRLAKSLS